MFKHLSWSLQVQFYQKRGVFLGGENINSVMLQEARKAKPIDRKSQVSLYSCSYCVHCTGLHFNAREYNRVQVV